MIIVIPTCKDKYQIAPLVCEIEGWSFPVPVYAPCRPITAAANRNDCLRYARNQPNPDIVIMCDDDIRGFYEDWAGQMADVLVRDASVMAVSARPMTPDGGFGPMMGMEHKPNEGLVEVSQMPSSCIAFRLTDALNFDERFPHSGYEDTYWCWCMRRKYPDRKFVVANGIRLIHKNERKGQENLEINRGIYERLILEDPVEIVTGRTE